MRTECLVDPGCAPVLSVRIRCLQAQHRRVEEAVAVVEGPAASPGSCPQRRSRSTVAPRRLGRGGRPDVRSTSRFICRRCWPKGTNSASDSPGGTETELVRPKDSVAGRFVRRREPIDGRVMVDAIEVGGVGDRGGGTALNSGGGRLVKIAVTVENHRARSSGESPRRDHGALPGRRAHDAGRRRRGFVSLLDPPEAARSQAATCRSDGTYPVLIGDDDVVLSSPIILYDHPEVAPQSPGDLYDSTEIDEILALRVMTLTDEEKSEAEAPTPERPPSSTAATTCRPRRGAGCTGRCAWSELPRSDPRPVEETRSVPWWDPEADASFDPWTESVMSRRRRDHQGQRGPAAALAPGRRPGHLPRRAGAPPWPASSRTSTATARRRHRRRRSRHRGAVLAGPVPVLPPRRGRASERRDGTR